MKVLAVKQLPHGDFICRTITATGAGSPAELAAYLAVNGYPDYCFIDPANNAPIYLTITVSYPSKVQPGRYIPSDYQCATLNQLDDTIAQYRRDGEKIGALSARTVASKAGDAGQCFINMGAFKRSTQFASGTIFKA